MMKIAIKAIDQSYEPKGIKLNRDASNFRLTKRCCRMYNASQMEFARKKIQAKQTRLKVKNILRPFTTCGGREKGKVMLVLLQRIELTMKIPCNAPQIMKVKFVPCQSPLASIVNMGGRASAMRLSEVSPLFLRRRLNG